MLRRITRAESRRTQADTWLQCTGSRERALARVDVDADGDEEDGDEAEVDDGVDENGGPARLHVAELHDSVPPGDLEQQARGQQHEQHHRYQHRSPVCHSSFSSSSFQLFLELESTATRTLGFVSWI